MNNQKEQLIESLREKGFSNEILKAFSEVKRENFIPKNLKKHTYEDTALPIGQNQTISQPYTISVMFSLAELKKGGKVLEVGSGCGYVLALLSRIVEPKGKVFGIEIIKELSEKSKENTKEYKNIEVYCRDGNKGLREKAPFDRILISAGIDEIPLTLKDQLKENGIIVAPINENQGGQTIISFKKIKGKVKIIEKIPGFIFVPFV